MERRLVFQLSFFRGELLNFRGVCHISRRDGGWDDFLRGNDDVASRFWGCKNTLLFLREGKKRNKTTEEENRVVFKIIWDLF